MESIRLLIHDGQKKGAFKKNIDIFMMMAAMIGITNQVIVSGTFYRKVAQLEEMEEVQFREHIRKKVSIYLKKLFKALLTYDEK